MNTIILTIILITSVPTSYPDNAPMTWKQFTVTQEIDGWQSVEECKNYIDAHKFDDYITEKRTIIAMYPEHPINDKAIDITMYCTKL
jgi:hypothetical protein